MMRDEEVRMHNVHTALVVVALASAALLLAQSRERLFAGIAFIGAAIEALIVFKLMTLSVTTIRIDVILPALLVVGGGMAWYRTTEKSHVTAATLVTIVGVVQLLEALRVLS
jgi:hypothetical protein